MYVSLSPCLAVCLPARLSLCLSVCTPIRLMWLLIFALLYRMQIHLFISLCRWFSSTVAAAAAVALLRLSLVLFAFIGNKRENGIVFKYGESVRERNTTFLLTSDQTVVFFFSSLHFFSFCHFYFPSFRCSGILRRKHDVPLAAVSCRSLSLSFSLLSLALFAAKFLSEQCWEDVTILQVAGEVLAHTCIEISTCLLVCLWVKGKLNCSEMYRSLLLVVGPDPKRAEGKSIGHHIWGTDLSARAAH